MYVLANDSSITPDSLNALFAASGSGLPHVTGVAATALDGGYGYLSRSYRLHLRWEAPDSPNGVPAPKTLVAKLPLAERLDEDNPSARRMYRREAMFHRTVAPDAPIRTARCWAGEIDAESGLSTMAFDDLGRLKTFEDDESISVDRVENALRQLARLHARFWNSPELDEMDWLAHPAVTGVDQVSVDRFAALWPTLVNSGAYDLSSVQLRVGELLSKKLDCVYEQLHAGPFSLTHTDLHQENLFFDGDEAVFIDWAAAERANPAKDVAKLTSSCLAAEIIADEQPRLLGIYRDELVDAMEGDSTHPLTPSLISDGTREGEASRPSLSMGEGSRERVRPSADGQSDRQGQHGQPADEPTHPLTPSLISNGTREGEVGNRSSPSPGSGEGWGEGEVGPRSADRAQQAAPLPEFSAIPSLTELERYVHLAMCHYLGMMTFLSDARDFDALAANMESRTDHTTSRVIAACDREDLLEVIEAL